MARIYSGFFSVVTSTSRRASRIKAKKAFHIGRAEAVEFVIVFGEGERVARPAAIIERHGIGMPGEQQAAGAVSGAGQQIEFMARIRHRLYLDVEAEIAEPAGQQID